MLRPSFPLASDAIAPRQQHRPVDGLVPVWQHEKKIGETGNQFSLAREASKTGGAAKKQIPAISCDPQSMLRRLGRSTYLWRHRTVRINP
jgi:hypothetical protein